MSKPVNKPGPGRGFGQGRFTALEAFLGKTPKARAAMTQKAAEIYLSRRRLGMSQETALREPGVCSESTIGDNRTVRSYRARAAAGEQPFADHFAAIDAAELQLLEQEGKINLDDIMRMFPVEWRKIVLPDQMGDAARALRRQDFKEALSTQVLPAILDAMLEAAVRAIPEALQRIDAGDDREAVLRTLIHTCFTEAIGDE